MSQLSQKDVDRVKPDPGALPLVDKEQLARRRGLLSTFTRLANEFDEHVADDRDVDISSEAIEKLKNAFSKYLSFHEYVIANCSNVDTVQTLKSRHVLVHSRFRSIIDSCTVLKSTQFDSKSKPPVNDSHEGSERSDVHSKSSMRSSVSVRQASLSLAKAKAMAEAEKAKAAVQGDLNVKLAEMELKFALEQEQGSGERSIEGDRNLYDAVQVDSRKRTEQWVNAGVNVNAHEFTPHRSTQVTQPPMYNPTAYHQPYGIQSIHPPYSFLPRPQILTFDGKLTNFTSFYASFMTHIGSQDMPTQFKLGYLVQFCSGDAKEAIQDCLAERDIEKGYAEALKILHEQFGRQHDIVRSHLLEVVNGPVIQLSDAKGLMQLARKMHSCSIALSSSGYGHNLDSEETLRKIAVRLPKPLRVKWVEKASKIIDQMGLEPTFKDLEDFVFERARVASCSYADIIADSDKKTSASTPQKAKIFNTSSAEDKKGQASSVEEKRGQASGKEEKKCQACEGNHLLYKCEKFAAMTLEERTDLVKKLRICFNCLREGHGYKYCPRDSFCKEGCKSKHNNLLHRKKTISATSAATVDESDQENQKTHAKSLNTESPCKSSGISLQVVRAFVKAKDGGMHSVSVLLDQGSNISLCTQELFRKLGQPGKSSQLTLDTVVCSGEFDSREIHNVEIISEDQKESLVLKRVCTFPKLPRNSVCPQSLEQWPHLADISLTSVEDDQISILIGVDNPDAFRILEVREGVPGSPYAIKYPLGWTVIGPVGEQENSFAAYCVMSDKLEEQMARLWSLDFNDMPSSRQALSQDDEKALKIMEETAYLDEEGHWTIRLPWKQDPPPLEDNRVLAENRLKGLLRKFEKSESFKEEYVRKLNTYIENGFATRVTSEGADEKIPKYYLPHHGVYHPQKKKLRVVFDCSAKFNGISLNDCLLQGPDHLNSLVGVLMRFRQEEVALTADVEAMFHQVRVAQDDQNALRFLWFDKGDITKPIVEYRMTVHLFGATSSPSVCCFALQRTADLQKGVCSQEAHSSVHRNFYMDDLLKSVSSKEKAAMLAPELMSVLKSGGFRLTKWTCSEPEALLALPACEQADSMKVLDCESFPTERALGLLWNVGRDTFHFRIKIQEGKLSRRSLLSETASLYDPCGFVAPVLLTAKKLLQALSIRKIAWDDVLPDDIQKIWIEWKNSLNQLEAEGIRRCYMSVRGAKVVECQLHMFSDASEVGYASVAYLRMKDEEDNVHVSYVFGKSRVAPAKTASIPRLELTSAALSAKIALFVREELEIEISSTVYWTDSMTVLRYLANTEKRFKVFVANRLSLIRELSDVGQWKFVPSSQNPADVGSRGIMPSQGDRLHVWIFGPEFLKTDDWPKTPPLGHISQDDKEIKSKDHLLHTVAGKDETLVSSLVKKYSSWFKLRRVTAWILRFVRCCRKYQLSSKILELKDLQEAENFLFKSVQVQYFGKEYNRLQGGQQVPKKDLNRLRQLNPCLVDGVMRVGGRLRRADCLSFSAKHPVILPPESPLSTLIARSVHESSGHCGVEYTLAQMRKRFWIIRGKPLIKRIIRSEKGGCIKCRRYNSKLQDQQMADLPQSRLEPNKRPFTDVGIDYFGPILVVHKRSREKRYGCIFTCLASRAVHFEIAHSLNTDSFLAAFQRFVARRGKPLRVYSDNGTNFVSGSKELKEGIKAWNKERISNYMLQKDVEWEFNPPSASHFGGIWERMIRSARSILQKVLDEQIVKDEGLLTIIAEVEKILNDRPLMPVSDDPDSPPLTPNQLLLLETNECLPLGLFENQDSYSRRWWRQANFLCNVFWRRWIHEYVPTLQKRQKWHGQKENLKVGDLVLIGSDVPRGEWPLARVSKTYPDDKGLVRTVEVKTSKGTFKRPVHKLCLLERI